MINLENISKKWQIFYLDNINLEVEDNEYFIILGPTGAGKTLLLETIAGIHYPDAGRIFINGREMTYAKPEVRGLALVYQDYLLFPHLTVFENIAIGLRVKKVKNVSEKVEALSELFKISHLLYRYPRTLSGGEQQRVSLARALVVEPKLLLLDEPLASLDVLTQKKLREELKRVHNELGITTIHVTHNHEEALVLGNRIGVMSNGRITQIGSGQDIFRKPSTKFVADFVGVENIFSGDAKIDKNITEINVDGLKFYSTVEKSGTVNMCVRPEDIIISNVKIETSARNVLHGKVIEMKELGALIKLVVDCQIPFVVAITRQSFMELDINLNSEIYLYFKASNVHLF